MKGLRIFLGETWWIFLAAATFAVLLGYFTRIWIYFLFPPMLVPVILYMSSVRYDSDGNLRDEKRRQSGR